MFRIYRKEKCFKSHHVQTLYQKLDYDYQAIFIDSNARIEEHPEDAIFPVSVDEDNILQESGAIIKRIQELEIFKVERGPIWQDQ